MSAEMLPPGDRAFVMIGCGSIGKRHLSNLKGLGAQRIVAFDVRPDRRQEVEERFHVPTCDDLEKTLAAGGVALICSPTMFHLKHSLAAARANCHLFIEKPLSNTLDGVDELLAEVARRRLKTLVGCNFRFHPGLRTVKRLLDEQAIGTIVSARAQFGQYLPDWHPWEDYRQGYSAQKALGGGVILDRIHEFDYLRWLLGEVSGVFGMNGHLSRLEGDTEDTAEILLHFSSGALGSIHLDYVRRTYDCELELVGDEGTIQWRYQDSSVSWYRAAEGKWQQVKLADYDGNEMYLEEMRHFLRVLNGEEQPELDAREGKRVLAIALAAKQAALEKRVIEL